MVWAWSGMRGGAVMCWLPRLIVADRNGRRVWMIFLMLTPVRACASREIASAAKLLQGEQVRRGQHAGVGDDDHIGDVVAFGEACQNRDQGLGLGLVPFEHVHIQ